MKLYTFVRSHVELFCSAKTARHMKSGSWNIEDRVEWGLTIGLMSVANYGLNFMIYCHMCIPSVVVLNSKLDHGDS